MNDRKTELQTICDLLNDDNLREAEERLAALATDTIHDAACHLELADACEAAGMLDRALRELNLACRDAPGDARILGRLAGFHRDSGDAGKAGALYRKLIALCPDDASGYAEFGALLEETGEPETARQVYREAFEKTADRCFLQMLARVDARAHQEQSLETSRTMAPDEHHMIRFLHLFAGRENAYARQWTSPTGETGYTPVREPLTPLVARQHILGDVTCGVYQLRSDATVAFMAFDLDLPKDLLKRIITNKREWDAAQRRLHQYACRLVDTGASLDIPVYIEDSGFKGRHCWIFLEDPLPARVAKRFGRSVLQRAGDPPEGVHVELFPKQTFVREGGLGNLIKLPLGIHRKSGKRSCFLNADGSVVSDQLACMMQMRGVSKAAILNALKHLQPEPDVPAAVAPGPPPAASWSMARPAADVLQDDAYDMAHDGELQYVLFKCPALRMIADRIDGTGHITADERIVLTHSLGHLSHGPKAVNTLLAKCMDRDEGLFLKSRLRGNPISCPKIRQRVPHITSAVACKCAFDVPVNMYPTPILHLRSMQAAPAGKEMATLQIQGLVQDYLRLRKQIADATELFEQCSRRLSAFFDQAGLDTLRTPMGTLKRRRDADGGESFSLEW